MDDQAIEAKILRIVMMLPIIVPAIAVHEFGHAWMADRCGDDTPRRQGRVTLDPLQHFEPMGAIMILVTAWSGIGFGWGRPVLVNPNNFNKPRRDDILVTAAGPAMNLLQAVFWLFILIGLRFAFGPGVARDGLIALFSTPSGVQQTALWIAMQGVLMNIGLIAFNLLPIPPLDGSRIVSALSPPTVRDFMRQLEMIGPFLVLLLLAMPGIYDKWAAPARLFGYNLIFRVLGIGSIGFEGAGD